MLTPILVVSSIGLLFGITLTIASKLFYVSTNKKIAAIEEALPSANCGACGYAGCSAFAKALVNGEASTTGCIPGGSEVAQDIADVLGIEAGHFEPLVAAVHCKGGVIEAKERAIYDGITDCNAAEIVSHGSKECLYDCLGLGSCVTVCEFDAIFINDNGIAEVDPTKCTGCMACISACPRDIISMVPKSQFIFLGCNNHDRGAKVKKYCSVGCTGCTLCTKAVSHEGSIEMVENLPLLHYNRGENFVSAANKCPSNSFIDLVGTRPVANINSKCTGCGNCVPVCPVKNTITGESGGRYVIDKDKCIGCGICLASCEVGAITLWGSLGYNQKHHH